MWGHLVDSLWVQSVENGGYGRFCGRALHFTGLKPLPPPLPTECNGDCDALEEGSVTHQIKGEDGAMTGIQQVRPTLFHVFLFIFFENFIFWCKSRWICFWFFWLMVMFPLVFSCDWEGMVVLISWNLTTMVWAADCYFQDLGMFWNFFGVLWDQGGSLIHIHNHTWIWPHFVWMKLLSILKEQPCPVPIISIPSPQCPRVRCH